MAKRIIRERKLTDQEAARVAAIRAEFAHKPTKKELLASGNYAGPMSVEEYLDWRRKESDAPLANQLREAIRSCGKPISTIAEASGVPQPVVQRFVSGERGITIDTAGKLAAYLRLSLQPDSMAVS